MANSHQGSIRPEMMNVCLNAHVRGAYPIVHGQSPNAPLLQQYNPNIPTNATANIAPANSQQTTFKGMPLLINR